MTHASGEQSDPVSRVSDLLERILAEPVPVQATALERACASTPECATALRAGYASLQQLGLLEVGQPGDEGGTAIGGLPRELGPFRLLEFLGGGGMGTVYRAEDVELGRPVALKLVRGELLASPRTRSRFQREAEALARLDHPGLCTIYRAGSTDGQPWIAMRLVRGTTLAAQLQARRQADGGSRRGSGFRDVRSLLALFERIARALATAHAAGVVHRDLKPTNILLTADDEPVVIDFGLVHLDDGGAELTASGDHIGTPAYMAPEQVEGRDVTPATDVYALAMTMFEALTLASPFPAQHREDLFRSIVRGERRRLRQVARQLPFDLEVVLEKALDCDPGRRYASMGEFADDLGRLRQQQAIHARPIGMSGRAWRWTRRQPLVAALLVALLLGITGTSLGLWRAIDEKRRADGLTKSEQAAKEAANLSAAAAQRRAAELETVAAFQEKQLRDLDPIGMGLQLRRLLLADARKLLATYRLPPADQDQRLRALEDHLRGIDFTNVAVRTLQQSVLDRAVTAIDDRFGSQPLIQARLLNAVAATELELGLQDAAIPVQRRVLDIRRQELEDDDPQTLAAAHDLGELLSLAGNLEEAGQLLADALERTRRLVPADTPLQCHLLLSLGALRSRQDRLGEAIDLTRAALELASGTLGPDDRSALVAASNLAGMLQRTGDGRAEVMALRTEALARGSRFLPADDRQLMAMRAELGKCLAQTGDHAAAEPLFEDLVERRRQVLGEEHPDTIDSIQSLGELRRLQGRYAEAEELLQRALRLASAILGPVNEQTVSIRNGLGASLTAQRRFDDAEVVLREGIGAAIQLTGPGNSMTVTMQSNLAEALMEQGRLDDAESILREVLARTPAAVDDTDVARVRLSILFRLSKVCSGRQQFEEAERLGQQALEGFRTLEGPTHSYTLVALSNLAGLRMQQGDPGAAADLLGEAFDGSLARQGMSHPHTLNYLATRGIALLKAERFDEAESAMRRWFDATAEPGTGDKSDLVHEMNGALGMVLAGQARALAASDRPAALTKGREAAQRLLDHCEWVTGEPRNTDMPRAIAVAKARRFILGLSSLYELLEGLEPGVGHADRAKDWAGRAAALE